MRHPIFRKLHDSIARVPKTWLPRPDNSTNAIGFVHDLDSIDAWPDDECRSKNDGPAD